MVLDHKHILNKQGDKESKCLGVSAVIPDRFGNQISVLLKYLPCNSSSADNTVPFLEELLVEFELTKQFQRGKISMSCDGAMVKTVKDLFELKIDEGGQGLYTYCNVHNLDNLMKRTVLHLLDEYLPGGTDMYKDIQTHISGCSKALGFDFNNMEVSPVIKNKVCFSFKNTVNFFYRIFK